MYEKSYPWSVPLITTAATPARTFSSYLNTNLHPISTIAPLDPPQIVSIIYPIDRSKLSLTALGMILWVENQLKCSVHVLTIEEKWRQQSEEREASEEEESEKEEERQGERGAIRTRPGRPAQSRKVRHTCSACTKPTAGRRPTGCGPGVPRQPARRGRGR